MSVDVKALQKAIEHLPKVGEDKPMKADNLDMIFQYKLSGDILEMTKDGKMTRFVREPSGPKSFPSAG